MKTAALLLLIAVAQAQTPADGPSVSNAKFETRAVFGDALTYLHTLVAQQQGPAWIGYGVPSNRTDGDSCCWDDRGSGCRLEGGNSTTGQRQANRTVHLEGSRTLLVLYRVRNRAIEKIHPVSVNCPIDAGGLPFVWLTGVTPRTSLALLTELVLSEGSHKEPDTALVAIAMHGGDAADQTLERFADPSQPEWLREKALFWLATARGSRGFSAVKHAAEHDPSSSIREKAMFDFSISPEPAAIDELIRFGKRDPTPRVREQAIFWLSQKAGERAASAIQSSIDNDPDIEVKKKAVFGLQQLPKDQGIPLLIHVAKSNGNREVRKQAMFWLGQTGDPRALAFFQEVLQGKL